MRKIRYSLVVQSSSLIKYWHSTTSRSLRTSKRFLKSLIIETLHLSGGKCGGIYDTSVQLCNHDNKHHVVTEKPRCQYCSEEFTKADHRETATRSKCKSPGYVQHLSNPRAPRGCKSRATKREEKAVTSDNGIPTYLAITRNTLDFPRVVPEAELADRLVYRGEVWCRYPGCEHQTKYSCPAKLRMHYKNAYNFEYPVLPPGNRECTVAVSNGWRAVLTMGAITGCIDAGAQYKPLINYGGLADAKNATSD